ncbi:hypothetical protein [Aquidulcibacter sp.]|uniref:hypothetical protein n=1 Tax=Aquidulcibacter sp. TaxID=2052990 RepID=UPI0025BA74ED|nr:hypothetical protein [Aquidulcibacter sp.]
MADAMEDDSLVILSNLKALKQRPALTISSVQLTGPKTQSRILIFTSEMARKMPHCTILL